jgi:hypothetical protein
VWPNISGIHNILHTNHISKSTHYSKFTSAMHINESASGSRQLGSRRCSSWGWPDVRSRWCSSWGCPDVRPRQPSDMVRRRPRVSLKKRICTWVTR